MFTFPHGLTASFPSQRALQAQLPQNPQALVKDLHKGHSLVLLFLPSSQCFCKSIQVRIPHSPSNQSPAHGGHAGGGCSPSSLTTSLLQGTAMYKCSQGCSALILFNANTKHLIPSRGQNISELTLWHLYACIISFFSFLLRMEASDSRSLLHALHQPEARSMAAQRPHLRAGSEQSSVQAAAQGMKQTAKAAHGTRALHCPSACGETEAQAVGVNYQTLQRPTLTYSCFLLGHTTTVHSCPQGPTGCFPPPAISLNTMIRDNCIEKRNGELSPEPFCRAVLSHSISPRHIPMHRV